MSPDRPLKDKRPLGPVLQQNNQSEDEDGNSSEKDNLTRVERNIIEQAENWYKEISREEKKRKMMINYIDGITDDEFGRRKAREMVKNAGL
jgi:hypothetical protein